MNIIHLKGLNIDEDKNLIFEKYKNENTVFVLDNEMPLCEYLEHLELSDAISYQIKICKEIKNIDVDYKTKKTTNRFTLFSQILEALDLSHVTYITVNGDLVDDVQKKAEVRIVLSDIVQQLIYLGLPLDLVQVMTEYEYKNNDKVKKFEQNIAKHEKNVSEALHLLEKKDLSEYNEIKSEVIEALQVIQQELAEVKNSELKIAVAASKKSGKSVIVNDMIGCELAPTSLELATPNNCIYKDSANGYYLQNGEEKVKKFSSPKELKESIKKLFKEAEKDKDSGYAIPDMTIGYVPKKQELSSYTIYDTPGPDLAGATGHKEAAYKATDEADVIVFAIDYSKHLQESEVNYLKDIRENFEKQKKHASLIITVNKLDLRYTSENDKCVIRILDFIRNKLIRIAPEFRDCIVIGTSALTYFNCIEAVTIPGCECLQASQSLCRDLGDCIDKYIGKEEVTILNQIQQMVQCVRNFHGKKVNDLEQLKGYSGIPNLLDYVGYIARGKARTERVNNIIHHIDNQYVKIQNLFHFQELEEELVRQQDKLEWVKKNLEDFKIKVNEIYNEEYSDVRALYEKKGATDSVVINKLGRKTPFELEEMEAELKKEYVEKDLNEDAVIEHVLKQIVVAKLGDKVVDRFKKSKRIEKINGKEYKVVSEDAIEEMFENVLLTLSSDITGYLRNLIPNRFVSLLEEYKNIQKVLENVVNNRLNNLKAVIEEYKQKLNEECDIPFNIEVPEFDFAFKSEDKQSDINIEIQTDIITEKVGSILKQHMDYSKIKDHGDNILGEISINCARLFRKLRGKENEINKICYDKDEIIRIYKEYMCNELAGSLKNEKIGETYQDEKQSLIKNISGFVDYTKKEMKEQQKSATGVAEKVEKMFNHTDDIEKDLCELEKKKRALEIVAECVTGFSTMWKSDIREESDVYGTDGNH